MKLTKNEKSMLLDYGYTKEDFPQIEETTTTAKLTLIDKRTNVETKIGVRKAIKLLGEAQFISGIARCAFHYTAVRIVDDMQVFFDNSKMFA